MIDSLFTMAFGALLGREIRVLHDELWPAQTTSVLSVRADDLPNGVYYVRVRTPTYAYVGALTLAR